MCRQAFFQSRDSRIPSWQPLKIPIRFGLCYQLSSLQQSGWLCLMNGVGSERREIYQAEKMNSLWPSDTIWWHRSRPTLVHVMACCLTAPSHYLNQCWVIISQVWWHSLRVISQEMLQISITDITLKMTNLNLEQHPPGANELTCYVLNYKQAG